MTDTSDIFSLDTKAIIEAIDALVLGGSRAVVDTSEIFSLDTRKIIEAVEAVNIGGEVLTKTGTFTGFTAAEAKTLNLTGLTVNNPVIRSVELYINNDPGADQNINCRLSFYNADSMTEDELLIDFFFNLSFTETNGGASATDTTDVVDDISGLVKYDLIRYLGGTAENVRLSATPSGTTLTFTALANDHADNTGVVRVTEIAEMFQLVDNDASLELHAKLEFLSTPNASTNITISVDIQQ